MADLISLENDANAMQKNGKENIFSWYYFFCLKDMITDWCPDKEIAHRPDQSRQSTVGISQYYPCR